MPRNPDRGPNQYLKLINLSSQKTRFYSEYNWGGGDYKLRRAQAAKRVWVVVITNWGTLHSPPPPHYMNNCSCTSGNLCLHGYMHVWVASKIKKSSPLIFKNSNSFDFDITCRQLTNNIFIFQRQFCINRGQHWLHVWWNIERGQHWTYRWLRFTEN